MAVAAACARLVAIGILSSVCLSANRDRLGIARLTASCLDQFYGLWLATAALKGALAGSLVRTALGMSASPPCIRGLS